MELKIRWILIHVIGMVKNQLCARPLGLSVHKSKSNHFKSPFSSPTIFLLICCGTSLFDLSCFHMDCSNFIIFFCQICRSYATSMPLFHFIISKNGNFPLTFSTKQVMWASFFCFVSFTSITAKTGNIFF